jgi:hypothetical protein
LGRVRNRISAYDNLNNQSAINRKKEIAVKKWIIRIVVGVLVLVVAAVGLGWLMLDSIAKKGIQKGGEYALGVPTDVKDLSLSLLGGNLKINQLQVSNPQGFHSPHFVKTGLFEVEVQPLSVFGKTVQVRKFVLDGLSLNIEQIASGNNVSVVLDHIKKLGGPGEGNAQPQNQPKPQGDSGGGKKVHLTSILIKNVEATFHLPLIDKPLTVKVPQIELKDIGNDSPDGIPVGRVIAQVLPAILASVMEAGKGVIPADFAGLLNHDIAGAAQSLGGDASKMIQQVGGDAAGMVRQLADKQLQDVQKGLGGIQNGLGGAFKNPLDKPAPPK